MLSVLFTPRLCHDTIDIFCTAARDHSLMEMTKCSQIEPIRLDGPPIEEFTGWWDPKQGSLDHMILPRDIRNAQTMAGPAQTSTDMPRIWLNLKPLTKGHVSPRCIDLIDPISRLVLTRLGGIATSISFNIPPNIKSHGRVVPARYINPPYPRLLRLHSLTVFFASFSFYSSLSTSKHSFVLHTLFLLTRNYSFSKTFNFPQPFLQFKQQCDLPSLPLSSRSSLLPSFSLLLFLMEDRLTPEPVVRLLVVPSIPLRAFRTMDRTC